MTTDEEHPLGQCPLGQQPLPEAAGGRAGSSLEPQREHGPADSLILNFQPLEL